jgi:hypothetical protein
VLTQHRITEFSSSLVPDAGLALCHSLEDLIAEIGCHEAE